MTPLSHLNFNRIAGNRNLDDVHAWLTANYFEPAPSIGPGWYLVEPFCWDVLVAGEWGETREMGRQLT